MKTIIAVCLIIHLFVACSRQDSDSSGTEIIFQQLCGSNPPGVPVIVYSIDDFECEQCLISHLKMLNELTLGKKVVLILNFVGESIPLNFQIYKKLYSNELQLAKTDPVDFQELNEIKIISTILVFDRFGKYLTKLHADPEKIHWTKIQLEGYIRN